MDIYRAAKRRGKYQPLATDTEVNSCCCEALLLRSLSEAAALFLTDRVGPGRFIICELSRSDFFHGR